MDPFAGMGTKAIAAAAAGLNASAASRRRALRVRAGFHVARGADRVPTT